MREIVKICAGHYGTSSRPLFENTGLAGYFSIATEIPQTAFDVEVPREDFSLLICDERIPQEDLVREKYLLPSMYQALWAIGFAPVNLMNSISMKPLQFIHPPFRIPHNSSEGPEVWRQIKVRRIGSVYLVGTVCSSTIATDSNFAYMMNYR